MIGDVYSFSGWGLLAILLLGIIIGAVGVPAIKSLFRLLTRIPAGELTHSVDMFVVNHPLRGLAMAVIIGVCLGIFLVIISGLLPWRPDITYAIIILLVCFALLTLIGSRFLLQNAWEERKRIPRPSQTRRNSQSHRSV